MKEREQKTLPFELKEFDEATGSMAGYAAVFGNLDDGDDVILPGAFAKTLQENAHRVRICWQHDWREPIGKPTEMREVGRDELPETLRARFPAVLGGLFVRGVISDTRQGRDARVLMRDNVVTELSIGYDAIKVEAAIGEDGLPLRRISEIRLWEFSPVTWAMNPAAVITDAKGEGNEPGDEPDNAEVPPAEAAEPGGSSLTALEMRARALALKLKQFQLEDNSE